MTLQYRAYEFLKELCRANIHFKPGSLSARKSHDRSLDTFSDSRYQFLPSASSVYHLVSSTFFSLPPPSLPLPSSILLSLSLSLSLSPFFLSSFPLPLYIQPETSAVPTLAGHTLTLSRSFHLTQEEETLTHLKGGPTTSHL